MLTRIWFFQNCYMVIYSGTSLSGGAWDGNFRVSPHSPVIICAKKALYYKIFLPLNSAFRNEFPSQ